MLPTALTLTLLIGQASHAATEVRFVESAPKDRFVITNVGECALEASTLDMDLTRSAGRLVFDTTAAGAGVEVFQPFEVVEGNIEVLSPGGMTDGDALLSLNIASLAPGASASFSIDVDDTLPASQLGQIRVSAAEIAGGLLTLTEANREPVTAEFGNDSKALLPASPCSAS